ncbi:hypothetical protein ETAA8_40780 [Anatilimnocola aggregata]|uniref:Uncharacterized protein n=1 Tax=Anatilimnocola aggregata TaxID=2528021 RepID=A0A517YFM7_9BACT|nr:hypothetical protein ETAA8_40780 [Anatilimnocola aggregata]
MKLAITCLAALLPAALVVLHADGQPAVSSSSSWDRVPLNAVNPFWRE